MDLLAVLSAARTLSFDDRIALVQTIWHEITSAKANGALTDAQLRELDRRIADDDANPDDVVAWEVIKAEASSR
jgi:putative addiction module component (TIGR02574 family)